MNWQEFALFEKRTFLPFFVTQFCGAFNDNVFKLLMLTLISYSLSRTQSGSEYYQVIASAIYIFPFFIFSALAGQLADKYNKVKIIWWVKSFEVFLMVLGSFGLLYKNISVMLFVLFGMGVHSAFFGPIKYSLLPEQLPGEDVFPATAFIEASTFMAILIGTILGSLCAGLKGPGLSFGIGIINVIAWLGLFTSLYIPQNLHQQNNPLMTIDYQLWRSTKQMILTIAHDKKMFPIILVISWFWLIGAVILMKLPDYVHYILGASSTVFALFLTLFSVGIALGSLCISHYLSGKLSLRLVPVCMMAMSIFAIDLYWATPVNDSNLTPHVLTLFWHFIFSMSNLRVLLDFFLLSFCGGLFVVPLYTYLQVGGEDNQRSRLIAGNNILNAIAMVLGSGLVMFILQLNLSIPTVFLIIGILNVIASLAFGVYYWRSNGLR